MYFKLVYIYICGKLAHDHLHWDTRTRWHRHETGGPECSIVTDWHQ